MKKYILLLVAIAFFSACDNDNYSNNNKYLPNYNFSIDIDLDLPLYTDLRFPGNKVRISQAGIGINGVIVMNTGSGYAAYEASCPNQPLTSCSGLTLNGINAVCNCDQVSYSLYTGLPNDGADVHYPLKPYRVEILGDTAIRIYN
jgi:nitrite reductase/ring-hydroxylating ferredoxin subunit